MHILTCESEVGVSLPEAAFNSVELLSPSARSLSSACAARSVLDYTLKGLAGFAWSPEGVAIHGALQGLRTSS